MQRGFSPLLLAKQIEWHFLPRHSAHFGGLRQSEVKNMKQLMRKIVGVHWLTYEELNTVAAEAEATMNSTLFLPVDSLPDDGVPLRTPGHFLIGCPLLSLPVRTNVDPHISTLKRWNLYLKLMSSGNSGAQSISRIHKNLWKRHHKGDESLPRDSVQRQVPSQQQRGMQKPGWHRWKLESCKAKHPWGGTQKGKIRMLSIKFHWNLRGKGEGY